MAGGLPALERRRNVFAAASPSHATACGPSRTNPVFLSPVETAERPLKARLAYVPAALKAHRIPDEGRRSLCQQQPSQPVPRQASAPPWMAAPEMMSATAGSSHQRPKSVLPSRPARTPTARPAQSRFCFPSPRVAAEPSCVPMRRFQTPRPGQMRSDPRARPIPSQLVSA